MLRILRVSGCDMEEFAEGREGSGIDVDTALKSGALDMNVKMKK